MSIFEKIELQPEDPILGLGIAFNRDVRPNKVNLGIGSYKDTNGHPQVFSSVRKVEKQLSEQYLDKEYLPILGNVDYVSETLKLIFHQNSPLLAEGVVLGAGVIGGTGALRMGAEFLFQNNIADTLYVSDPTWSNHLPIFQQVGMKVVSYPYYNFDTHSLNFNEMCIALSNAPEGCVVMLQPCCHNPTGLVPGFEQWKELSSLLSKKKLIPFFDLAYQGFDVGIDEDAQVVRYFSEAGHQMLVASSYSKNFGLYGERVGHLALVCKDREEVNRVGSRLKQLIRRNYSSPPLHGEQIVATILRSDTLRNEWIQELDHVRFRIQEMRQALAKGLEARARKQNFDFLQNQRGMFSYSGLNKDQVIQLRDDFGVYMHANGRINVAGLNPKNLDYVIDSIMAVSG